MNTETGSIWAFGIVEPGWYCARQVFCSDYAAHLASLGYRVVQSIYKPYPDGRPNNEDRFPTR